MDCSRNDCDRVYHLNCAVGLSDVSWSYEGKLVCPQHVSCSIGFLIASVSVFNSLIKTVVSSEKELMLFKPITVLVSWGVSLGVDPSGQFILHRKFVHL